ncbi:mCG64965 [Mus musculus]|nr:mCG64965 [Mus musculus]
MVQLCPNSRSKTKHLLSLTSHGATVKGRHAVCNVPATSTPSLLQGLDH